MAKKIKGPQIILANTLDTGRVVFLSENNGWTGDASKAVVAHDDAGVEALVAAAQKSAAENLVVDPQPIAANVEGGVSPGHIKHAIQAAGPTVRLDLGYQVSTSWEG